MHKVYLYSHNLIVILTQNTPHKTMLLIHAETHLLLACEYQQAAVVQYLLTTHHINPNTEDKHHQTPLSLARNKDVIKLLIQHGANAENVYALHRRILNNVFSKDPVKSPVKIFVIGHGGAGKSTLIEAMEHEPTFWTSVVNVLIAPKEVEGVDQRTAGIIPRIFNSRFFGSVQFLDFAGQEAYYSSHAAIIGSVVDTCPPVFILVIGLHRDKATISHSVSYWLGIISNQCGKMEGKAPLIIVGSHADLIGSLESDYKMFISRTVEKFSFFDLVSVISMDCRYSNSSGMKLLRHSVGTTCKSLRSQLSVSLNSHMFLIYLLERYSKELALTLGKIQADLEAAINQKQSKKDKEVYSFIPTTKEHLREICVQLSDKGHILFLPSKTPEGVSFIIIDKTTLLAQINGTVFAPEDFKQHCQLATSTGVVPRSKLAKRFPKFNTTMLVRFLSHLELAVPIEDQKVMLLIDKHLDNKIMKSEGEKFLFCPALIRLEVPTQTLVCQSNFSYNFGWVLSSVYSEHFFDARFLHVLILRLALSLGLAPVVDPDIPALQHQCSVWKTGVCWSTSKGATVLVEVVDRKKVVVLFWSDTISYDHLKYRTNIVLKVRETARELCSSVDTEELLLSTSDVSYPLTTAKTTDLFSLKSVAQSLVNKDQFAVSICGIGRWPVSDLNEVYANLGENILQPLFNENDPVHTNRMSDQFLSAISSVWSTNPQLANIICSSISTRADTISQTVASIEKMKVALESWRDGSDGTYKSLRQILDQLSVFAGKSPFVSLYLWLCVRICLMTLEEIFTCTILLFIMYIMYLYVCRN